MPSLGFLKKKRTREANPGSSTAGSLPTSPVTPTASKALEQHHIPAAVHSSGFPAASQPGPGLGHGEDAAMNSLQHQAQFAPPVPTPSPGTEPQNLPSISNLINPPLQDGHAQPYQQQPQSRFPPPPANGGDVAQPSMGQPAQQAPTANQPRVTKGKYSLTDFEISRTLGTGSFGRVHLVQSRHNQRFYAVKVLKKAQVVKMKQVEHTNDERRMLGEVKHPFLITLWGTFQDPKNLYMVMDFVEGGELFSLLRKSVVSRSWPLPSA
jgi:protein kinase A